jgi:phosphatidylinositol alpha-1,6-mannosyltransferase
LKGFWRSLRYGAPDVVVGGSGLVGPVVVLLSKILRAKSIILVHGLDIVVDSRIYQTLFLPFLRRSDLIVSNSRNTTRLAVECGIARERIVIINPGVDIPDDPMSQMEAKELLGLQSKTVLLSVGRLIPRKGLPEFVSKCFGKLALEDSDIQLIIVGTEPENALNKTGRSVLQELQSAIQAHGLHEQVQLLGRVSEEKLAQLYSAADVFVFPLKQTSGDVEGFGMVSIEAAAHGTPTVAFDCGGVEDAIEDGASGFLVPSGDYQSFSREVIRAAASDMRVGTRAFARKFSWEQYSAAFERCVRLVVG